MQLTNFAAAEAALNPFSSRHLQRRTAYTLEHVQQFMAHIGNPQNTIPAVHIAGTSGKTSTAYYVAALLQAAGKRVGLLTSPHVHQLNERVQINLQPISERQFCDELGVYLDMVASSGIPLTYAEILYGFAFWEFTRSRVDVMVVEVGMGGTLDATNTMNRRDKICIITDIGFDHMNVLGTALGAIATQKAGIIGMDNKVFCYEQAAEIMKPIREAAKRRQADLQTFIRPAGRTVTDGLPLFQQRNSYLAVQAVQTLLTREGASKLTPAQITHALQVKVPGRMQTLRHGAKTIIIDGAHNAQKLEMLTASIATKYPARKLAVVLACIESPNRDTKDLLRALSPLSPHVICAPMPQADHTSRPAVQLEAAASALGLSHKSAPDFTSAVQALLQRPEPILLITGSLYSVDAAEKLLQSVY